MTATFKLYRSSEATRAASSTILETGHLLITDEGNIYVGDGITVASALLSNTAVLSGYLPRLAYAAATTASTRTVPPETFEQVDATGGSRTRKLAAGTAADDEITVKVTALTSPNTVTVQGDTGVTATTITFTTVNQAATWVWTGSAWIIKGRDNPKSYLDATYVPTSTLGIVNPAVVDARWSPSGMTDAGVGAFDSTRATANTSSFRAALAYAATNKLPIYTPAGTWDLKGQVKFLTAIPNFYGAGVDNTTFRFATGAGRTQAAIDAGSTSTTGYVVETADGLGTGFVFGNNTGNYEGPGGWVHDFTVLSASGDAPSYTAVDTTTGPSTAVGVCVNGVTQCTVERVRVSKFGVGFDMIGNCGGTEFRNCTAPYRENGLGFLFRGVETQTPPQAFAQSGSDISLFNCWFHGLYAGICAENGGTDLNVYGGQVSAGAASTTVTDGVAALVTNRFWCNGTIGTDGLPGPVPTPGTGAVGKITFKETDLEGVRMGYALFRSYSLVTILIEDCSIIAYQQNSLGATIVAPYGANNANGVASGPGVAGLFKMTGAGNSSVVLRNNSIKGAFVTQNWISIAGQSSGFVLSGEDNNGKQNSVFADYFGGANCTGNWLANLLRADSVTTTNGSPVVADASVVATDQGNPVSAAGIPGNSYVGTVIAGTSFRLSSSPTAQVDVNATASSTVTATIIGAPTNVFRFGGVTVPYRAANGALQDLNGLLLRNSSGTLQQSTDGATWLNVATGTVPVVQLLRKTGNSTATSNAVLASDSDLQFSALANGVYRASGSLVYAATQAADIQLAWSVPAGASLSGDMIGLLSSATSSTGQNTFTAQQGTGAKIFGGADAAGPAATKLFIQVEFIFVIGATPGTVALQWAQNSSTADATTVYSNSYLKVEKLA